MTTPRPEIESELNALHQESLQRSAELREIVGVLPAVVGRRAMVRMLVGDFRHNPHKTEIVRRGGQRATRLLLRRSRLIGDRLVGRPAR